MFKRNDENIKEYTALEEMQDELEWEKQKSKKEIKAREQESDCPSGVTRPAKQPEFQLVLHQG